MIKESAEYAVLYFCVLRFKKLDEKSVGLASLCFMSLREQVFQIHFFSVLMFQPYMFQGSVHCESFIF